MKADVLTRLAKAWLQARHPSAMIVEELSVAEFGGALVDVAAILPDRIIGIEVKGRGDSHRRLALQGAMFSRVCRSMYLLACPSIQKACSAARLPGWGELLVQGAQSADLVQCRASGLLAGAHYVADETGYALAPVALAAMPWTKEYPLFREVLGAREALPRSKPKSIEKVASHYPLRVIERAVCRVLRKRDWRARSVGGEIRSALARSAA